MMEEQQGLARQQVNSRNNELVAEVVRLLEQGASPEELAQMGVPMEVIQAAIEAIRNKMQMPSGDRGLAQMGAM